MDRGAEPRPMPGKPNRPDRAERGDTSMVAFAIILTEIVILLFCA